MLSEKLSHPYRQVIPSLLSMKPLPSCWSSNACCPQGVAELVASPHTHQLRSMQGPCLQRCLLPSLPHTPEHTADVLQGAGARWPPPAMVSTHQNTKLNLKGRFVHHLCEILLYFILFKVLRSWFSSPDLHIFLLSRLLPSDIVRQKQVCGTFEGTSYCGGNGTPWPR